MERKTGKDTKDWRRERKRQRRKPSKKRGSIRQKLQLLEKQVAMNQEKCTTIPIILNSLESEMEHERHENVIIRSRIL